MKVIVIGAVGTTAITIEKLHEHAFEIVGVLGHEPLNKNRVAGLNNLRQICENLSLEYLGFQKINDFENLKWAKEKQADIIFAVGFSQLLSSEWLNLTIKGCVGFHPTHLPRGRGRAPIAWSILEESKAAANFFLIGQGADDGPVFIQETFDILEDDDAESLIVKLRISIRIALDKWLPKLKNDIWDPVPQDDAKATYYGKREPCDSIINWKDNATRIDKLIKASTKPHDGAFTFFKDNFVIIWKSRVNKTHQIKGVVGRVLLIENNSYLVQCGENSSIWLEKIEIENNLVLKVGDKLGNIGDNNLDFFVNNKIWKKE